MLDEIAILCNTKMLGGGERSAQKILEMIQFRGLPAHGWSLTPDHPSRCEGMELWRDWRKCKARHQIWIMNDKIYRLQKEEFAEFITVLQYAEDIRIIINFVNGGLSKKEWLSDLPVKKVVFLNSKKRDSWLKDALNGNEFIPTAVLPPPVDIDLFLEAGNGRETNGGKAVIGSHGGKHSGEDVSLYDTLKNSIDTDSQFRFMPGNITLKKAFFADDRFVFHQKSYEMEDIINFLSQLSIYIYHLDKNKHTQGPRTVIEAMAMGLPVVTDDCSECGMRDRIVDGINGFLCSGIDDIIDKVKLLAKNPDMRKQMGENARKTAQDMRPEKWLDQIL